MYSRLALFFSALFFLFLAMACGEPGTPAARPTNGTSPTGPGGNGTGTGVGTGPGTSAIPGSSLGTGPGSAGSGSGLGTGSGTGVGTGPGSSLGTGLGTGKPSSAAAPFKKIPGSAGLGTTGGGPVKKITTGGPGVGGLGGKIPGTGPVIPFIPGSGAGPGAVKGPASVQPASVQPSSAPFKISPSGGPGKVLAPKKLKLPAIVEKYLNTYPINAGEDVAPLDIAEEHPASQKNVFGDARCISLFGDPPKEFIKVQAFSLSDLFREYVAGQVLTALGFATEMKCVYQDEKKNFQTVSRPPMALLGGYDLQVDIRKNNPAGGGVEVNVDKEKVNVQPSFQYLFHQLSKWIVVDPGAQPEFFKPYLSSSKNGLLTRFVSGLKSAGDQESSAKGDYNTSYKYLPWSDSIFSSYANKLVTDEMVLGFIKQMKDFIEEDPTSGYSALSFIVSGPISQQAGNDFAIAEGHDTTNVLQFAREIENKMRSRIKGLITFFERGVKADKELWKFFDEREKIRNRLAEYVKGGIKTDIEFDEKAFRAALRGKNYLDNPSSTGSLLALNADDLIKIEEERSMDIYLAIKKASILEKPEISFSYPPIKDYFIITDNRQNKAMSTIARDYIESSLSNSGFTLNETIDIEDPDLLKKVKKAIDNKWTLFVVGYLTSKTDALKELARIFAEYEDKNKSSLPRFVVEAKDENDARLEDSRLQSLYKDKAGNIILAPYVQPYERDKPANMQKSDVGFAVGFAVPIKPALGGSPVLSTLKNRFTSIDTLLDFIKEKATK